MYHIENCPGNPYYMDRENGRLKVCSNCTFPHRPENYDKVIEVLKTKI
jgi:Zn-finger protein